MRLAFGVAVLALCALLPLEAKAQGTDTRAVQYVCGQSMTFNAIFSADADSVVLEFTGHDRFQLFQTRTGSGFRYVGEGYELRGKGETAWLTPPQARAIECEAQVTPAAAPAQPIAQPSFDCRLARTQVELAICGSPALADLDRAMADLYVSLRDRLRGRLRTGLERDQRDWLGRRDTCGRSEPCLLRAYQDRIAALEQWAPPGRP